MTHHLRKPNYILGFQVYHRMTPLKLSDAFQPTNYSSDNSTKSYYSFPVIKIVLLLGMQITFFSKQSVDTHSM